MTRGGSRLIKLRINCDSTPGSPAEFVSMGDERWKIYLATCSSISLHVRARHHGYTYRCLSDVQIMVSLEDPPFIIKSQRAHVLWMMLEHSLRKFSAAHWSPGQYVYWGKLNINIYMWGWSERLIVALSSSLQEIIVSPWLGVQFLGAKLWKHIAFPSPAPQRIQWWTEHINFILLTHFTVQ